MGFGERLEMVLEEKSMSVAELSRATGISPSTLYSIIDRDTDNVGLDKVKKIENAVGAKPGNFIYDLLYNLNEVNIVEPKTDELREEVAALRYSLNDDGLAKTRDYMRDLMGNPKYKIGK